MSVLNGLHKLLVSAAEDATPDGMQFQYPDHLRSLLMPILKSLIPVCYHASRLHCAGITDLHVSSALTCQVHARCSNMMDNI